MSDLGAPPAEKIEHDKTDGGTEGNPHSASASDTDLSNHEGAGNPHSSSASDTDLSNHEGAGNPHSSSASTNHGNAAHSDTYVNATEAGAAAPVESVNGKTGAVDINSQSPFQEASSGSFGSSDEMRVRYAESGADTIVEFINYNDAVQSSVVLPSDNTYLVSLNNYDSDTNSIIGSIVEYKIWSA